MTDFRKGDVCSLEVVVQAVLEDRAVVGIAGCDDPYTVPQVYLTLFRRAPVDLATCELPVTVTVEGRRKTAVVARADTHALCRDNLGRWTAHAIANLRPLEAPAPAVSFAFRDENGDVQHQDPPTCPPGHIMIGDRAVPEPMREATEVGARYWAVETGGSVMVAPFIWNGDGYDQRMLARGLIHSTEANARAHAEAIIALSAGEGV